MSQRLSRRRFVQTTLATGAALLSTPRLGMSQPGGGGAALRVRRSALQLPASDPVFAKYADAVEKMHALPATDPRNWLRQAKIHADHCPHGTIGFLPWHRHYINYFEHICGQLIGDATFALPYWDWSYGTGKIPDPFFDITQLDVTHWNDSGKYDSPEPGGWRDIDTTNVRAIAKGLGVQSDPVRGGAFTSQMINSILGENQFNRLTRRIEGSPHNSGHVVVGFLPNKIGHMGSGLSPLDPLFWLHHCNVDRLWAQWQLAGNQTPTFSLPYNGHFVDANGQSVNVTADGAKDFSALGYTYEQFSAPANLIAAAGLVNPNVAENAPLLERLKPQQLTREVRTIGSVSAGAVPQIEVGIPASIPITVSDLHQEMSGTSARLDWSLPAVSELGARDLDAKMLADFGKPQVATRRILARLKDVQGSFDRNPVVNVFVNCPYLAPETPYSDVHYAGTFAFFGAHGMADHHGGGQDFYVDLTHALDGINLAAAESINVQLMAVPPSDGSPVAGDFRVGSIEILSV